MNATMTADAGRALRVVIAEDEALPAELLKRMLARLGYMVVGSAQNGLEALAMTRELKPDVVVMDLRMPVMDGWTALGEVARERLAPVVVVSALDDRAAVEQAVRAGASGFLTKPVREDDLGRSLEIAVARFGDAGSDARMGVLMRELTAARVQLERAGQRAAVTSVAHGLAHEINNGLQPIMGHAQLLGLARSDDAVVAEHVRQVLAHAQRIAGWTAVFRELTMGESRERMDFSFNAVANEVFAFFGERFERLGILGSLEPDKALPVMTGYPDRLQQVMMLLTQNAVEALGRGGTIVLKTRYLADTAEVLVTLSDSGVGIAPEHLPHVFEPGFSTKESGTHALRGWGLYAARLIVTAHHGTIAIASPWDNGRQGTMVRLQLPLQPDSPK